MHFFECFFLSYVFVVFLPLYYHLCFLQRDGHNTEGQTRELAFYFTLLPEREKELIVIATVWRLFLSISCARALYFDFTYNI